MRGATVVVSVGALADFLHPFLFFCFCFLVDIGTVVSVVLMMAGFLGVVIVSCPVLEICFFLAFLPPLWFLRLLLFAGAGAGLLPTASTMLIAGFDRLILMSSAFMLHLV